MKIYVPDISTIQGSNRFGLGNAEQLCFQANYKV